MPKSNRETIQRFNARMVQMYSNVLDIESSILFCKLCHCNINGTKIFSVQQHFRTMKHRSALELAAETGGTPWHPAPAPAPKIQLNTFSLDLCTTFLEANIPLETIDNPAMQMFLEKYTQKSIPNEATLRSEYVPTLYDKYIRKLQLKAKKKPIWISIAETNDNEQHLIANFVFGLIEESEKGKSYLLNMARLERANASSLAAFFNNSLQIIWPGKILYENIYLVVTESIPYMKTAMQSLKILYPNMIYVNCLLHTFDRLMEFIRLHFSQVDTFIINCEAVFFKSPHRQHLMRSKYHYLNLPSTTNATAGTWLKAALYYCNNFMEITSLLDMLSEEDDAECIQQAREFIQNTTLEADLIYLKQNFEGLSQAITQLESRDLTLSESLATIDFVKSIIQSTKRTEFINKFEQLLSENSGLQELLLLNSKSDNKVNVHNEKFWLYKYIPVVSANVEHLLYAKSLLENDKIKTLDVKCFKKETSELITYE